MNKVKLGLCGALLAAVGGTFLTTGTSTGRETAPTVEESFAVLARPATPADTLAGARSGVATRLAADRGSERVYVTHSGDRVCLVYQNAELAGSTCGTEAEAVSADSAFTLMLPQYPKGRLARELVAVLMPDDVKSVRVTEFGGGTTDVQVVNNVAVYDGRRPAELSWVVGGALHVDRGVLMPEYAGG